MKKLVTGILKKDHDRLPFTVIDVEKQFQSILVTDGKRVRIKGIVDRIDLKDDKIHIIDYKTGITDLTFSNIDDLFNREIKKRKKHIFQTFVYSYLYNTNNNSDFPVCPCHGLFPEFSQY